MASRDSGRDTARAEAIGAVEAVWRIESARVIAGLARIVNDVGLAEDLAQDALVAALEQWPTQGIPRSPGAWLMAIGKNRAIDRIRRDQRLTKKQEEIGRDLQPASSPRMMRWMLLSMKTSVTTSCV